MKQLRSILTSLLALSVLITACQPAAAAPISNSALSSSLPETVLEAASQEQIEVSLGLAAAPRPTPTDFPARPLYAPGELVDYTAQAGDTLPHLAQRFNTTVEEILTANTFIPRDATTMPPGMPMRIPIYYMPLWGTPYQIIPDSLFINGPAQVGFDTQAFVLEQPGWLKNYIGYASGANRTGAQIVDLVAKHYSVSPRLLLALLDFQAGALSQPELDPEAETYLLGYRASDYRGLYRQLSWAANYLNNGYYSWRVGKLTQIELKNGRLERFDPWQNGATVALHYYYNRVLPADDYAYSIGPDGLAAVYAGLFGDPWQTDEPHLPGSLTQPEFILPFEPGKVWSYTGGPHTGWGRGEPFAAIDFAPPSIGQGCLDSPEWVTAVADGTIVRSETGILILDLDGDGDERTGWAILYLHLATEGKAPLGAVVKQGDPLGHPSCEGGSSTGTHVHMARKYNGEWVLAGGLLAFNLEGWVAQNGSAAYRGTLTRFSNTVTACECSNQASFIKSDRPR
jgi:LasA protease